MAWRQRGEPVREDIASGDMVVLTRDASLSVMREDAEPERVSNLVGIVLERLESFEDEITWGVLVNGRLEQILHSEIQEVVDAGPQAAEKK